MKQSALDFAAPRPKCHNAKCTNPPAPGLEMCRACLAKFSPAVRARILKQ